MQSDSCYSPLAEQNFMKLISIPQEDPQPNINEEEKSQIILKDEKRSPEKKIHSK